MADVFLSYKRDDRDTVQMIVSALQKQGYSVWWDPKIDAGTRWDEMIERELEAAKCVLVVWSPESVRSRWVRTEANDGLERNVLIPVTIKGGVQPKAFNLIQAIDLSHWDGSSAHEDFRKIIAGVAQKVGNQTVAKPPAAHDPTTSQELALWEYANASGDAEDLRDFVRLYPSSAYVSFAARKLEKLDWQKAEIAADASEIEQFLAEYPAGPFADKARASLAAIARQTEAGAWDKALKSGSAEQLAAFEKQFPASAHAGRARALAGEIADEKAQWALLQTAATPQAVEEFLRRYPNGRFAFDARALAVDAARRQTEETAWLKVAGSRSRKHLQRFVKTYPASQFVVEATSRLEVLPKPKTSWKMRVLGAAASLAVLVGITIATVEYFSGDSTPDYSATVAPPPPPPARCGADATTSRGFKVYAGCSISAIHYSEIEVRSAAVCTSRCASDSKCQSFEMLGTACYLHDTAGDLTGERDGTAGQRQ